MRLVFALAAAAILAAVAIAFVGGTNEPTSMATTATQPAPPVGKASRPAADVEGTQRDVQASGQTARVLEVVSSLSELGKVAMGNGDQRSQAIYEMQHAMIHCEALLFQIKNPSRRQRELQESEKGREQFERNQRFAREFCDEAGVSQEQLQAAITDQLPAGDLLVQTMALDAKDPSSISLAKELASQTRSPAALQYASEFLIEQGEVLPAMKTAARPASLSGDEAHAEAQRLIVRMVTCQIRGGCGPNGLYTALWCFDCGPGLTLEQSWQRKYAPDTMAYARAITEKLVAGEMAK